MPSDREIEAVRDSIRELSGGHSLKSISGDYLWQTREPINITKALEAAEQERQDMHTELVEALKHAVEIAEAEQTGNWDDLLQYRELLNKANKEG